MKYTGLSCFSSFRCLADRCPDTCCAGWEIDLDADTLARYDRLPGPLGQRVRSKIQQADGYTFFALEHGRCPFLNGDGLCELILAQGDDLLSVTCREHPRFVEEYGGLRETCLSISCPEAARLLLEGPVELVTREDATPWEEDWELDEDLLAELLECRKLLFSMAHAQRPMLERLSIIIEAAGEMQSSLGARAEISQADIIETRVFRPEPDTPTALTKYFSQVAVPCRSLDLAGFWAAMQGMEFTGPKLPALLKGLAPDIPEDLFNKVQTERLLTYFLYRYVLRAVWDGALAEKVLFCVYSTAAILALSQTIPGPDALQAAASLYSREAEHSDENLALLYAFLAQQREPGL